MARLIRAKFMPPKPLKTSRCLIDSVFKKTDETLKGVKRRPTAQKGIIRHFA